MTLLTLRSVTVAASKPHFVGLVKVIDLKILQKVFLRSHIF